MEKHSFFFLRSIKIERKETGARQAWKIRKHDEEGGTKCDCVKQNGK